MPFSLSASASRHSPHHFSFANGRHPPQYPQPSSSSGRHHHQHHYRHHRHQAQQQQQQRSSSQVGGGRGDGIEGSDVIVPNAPPDIAAVRRDGEPEVKRRRTTATTATPSDDGFVLANINFSRCGSLLHVNLQHQKLQN